MVFHHVIISPLIRAANVKDVCHVIRDVMRENGMFSPTSQSKEHT